jgi:hypothetical protein
MMLKLSIRALGNLMAKIWWFLKRWAAMNWRKPWIGSGTPKEKLWRFWMRLRRVSSSWLSWARIGILKLSMVIVKRADPARKMILRIFFGPLFFGCFGGEFVGDLL